MPTAFSTLPPVAALITSADAPHGFFKRVFFCQERQALKDPWPSQKINKPNFHYYFQVVKHALNVWTDVCYFPHQFLTGSGKLLLTTRAGNIFFNDV